MVVVGLTEAIMIATMTMLYRAHDDVDDDKVNHPHRPTYQTLLLLRRRPQSDMVFVWRGLGGAEGEMRLVVHCSMDEF
jgi:hypothetical protein